MYVFLLWSMLIFFFIVWTIHVVIGWKQHTWHSICQGQRKNVHAWLLKMSKAKPVTSSYHKFSPQIFYIHSYSYIISSQVSKLYQCHCMTLIEIQMNDCFIIYSQLHYFSIILDWMPWNHSPVKFIFIWFRCLCS